MPEIYKGVVFMVDYITGINGAGKTRILSEAAAATAQISKGNVIFIDSTDKLEKILPSSIRFINISDYSIDGAMSLCGFLLGLCAGDYDLTDIFIDSTTSIVSPKETNLNDFFEILTKASEKTGVSFHFSVLDDYATELIYQSQAE